MRFVFIQAEKAHFPVVTLCRVMQVSRSGLYAWQRRKPSPRAVANRALGAKIEDVHRQSRRTYGSPRVRAALLRDGETASRHRVARLMRQMGLAARRRRRFVRTTDSNHAFPIAPNVLQRDFNPKGLNQVWATDITYVATGEGWLYLAVVIDLFSRMVVGWAMGENIDRHLVLRALDMALVGRGPPAGLIHHSDRGSQYASDDYQAALRPRGITCSMSRKGDCWDNAVVESFFATLKIELIYRSDFTTRNEARQAIFEYIAVFYHRQRLHSTLGYVTPLEYERAFKSSALAP